MLVATKLYPPETKVETILRQRLVNVLSSGTIPKLVIVSAPAGFGKTTLLTQWMKTDPSQVCWFSIDEGDRDPARFLYYLCCVLKTINAIDVTEALNYLTVKGSESYREIVDVVVGQIFDIDATITLILDDYHRANTEQIGQIMQYLLLVSPANLRVILSTRSTPHFSIASLRARGDLLELRDAELRFSLDETTYLFNDLRGLNLYSDEIKQLNEKAEGWIAALQLITLALKISQDRRTLIDRFSGSRADVADYLADEVFSRLPDSWKEFLLNTSLLERVNAELANVLTGRSDSQIILEEMENENLFIFPLDEDREWYRYHHLFQDFLFKRVSNMQSVDLQSLYQMAADWCKNRDLLEEAVNYALKGNDVIEAAKIVERNSLQLLGEGEMPRLVSWIKKIPEEVINNSVRLKMYLSWSYIHMGNHKGSNKLIKELEPFIETPAVTQISKNEEEITKIQNEFAIMKACSALTSNDLKAVIDYSKAVNVTQHAHPFFIGIHFNVLGHYHLYQNNIDEAEPNTQCSLDYQEKSGFVYGQVYANVLFSLIYLVSGRMHDAMLNVQNAEHLVSYYDKPVPFSACLAQILKGAVLYEWNALPAAEEIVTENLKLVAENAIIEIRILAYLTLSRIYRISHHYDEMYNLLERAYEFSRKTKVDRTSILLANEIVITELERNNTDAALITLLSCNITLSSPPDLKPNWERESCIKALMWCRYRIAIGEFAEVSVTLQELAKRALLVKRRRDYYEIKLLHAIVEFMEGRTEQSISEVWAILNETMQEDFVRLYLDQGIELSRLLQETYNHFASSKKVNKTVISYLHRIITYFEEQPNKASVTNILDATPNKEDAEFQLLENLTKREEDIILQLSRGFSNNDISKDLCISVNTVRWHVSNILKKLGVENRLQAMNRCRALGLIR